METPHAPYYPPPTSSILSDVTYANGDALLARLTAFVSCDWVDQ